jgi:hypothetical protein
MRQYCCYGVAVVFLQWNHLSNSDWVVVLALFRHCPFVGIVVVGTMKWDNTLGLTLWCCDLVVMK